MSRKRCCNLIRENGGEADIEKNGLQKKYPELYETLEEACKDLGHH
jgi:hypothetical protein